MHLVLSSAEPQLYTHRYKFPLVSLHHSVCHTFITRVLGSIQVGSVYFPFSLGFLNTGLLVIFAVQREVTTANLSSKCRTRLTQIESPSARSLSGSSGARSWEYLHSCLQPFPVFRFIVVLENKKLVFNSGVIWVNRRLQRQALSTAMGSSQYDPVPWGWLTSTNRFLLAITSPNSWDQNIPGFGIIGVSV